MLLCQLAPYAFVLRIQTFIGYFNPSNSSLRFRQGSILESNYLGVFVVRFETKNCASPTPQRIGNIVTTTTSRSGFPVVRSLQHQQLGRRIKKNWNALSRNRGGAQNYNLSVVATSARRPLRIAKFSLQSRRHLLS